MSESTVAAGPTATPGGLLSQYRPPESAYDELLAGPGELRPHYASLFRVLEQLGESELDRRCDASRRLVHEQGIVYNVYGDPRGRERPWALDPVPLVISHAEWKEVEAGLIQRARLLNHILADAYGPQDLIRSRWLSPALVFAQPDFLRPCHGLKVPHGTFLHFYAADLARSPDGRWWVTSDRTQIPTGAGYALANRLVTSRILPESYRENHVHRLAGFFRDVRDLLTRLAPRQAANARTVLLTPGPHNETYFEQAYLARYLGYMLVEGQDLTVHDDRVFLKTLNGLEPVDVILRRVDDDFCDPLELRNDSMLGVPGLVEAARAGNVAIANALGSGLVQSPAFMSFLPGLCRHVLNQELKLPSVATWWCGQAAARAYVLEHLEELDVRPAFRSASPGAGLPAAANLAELRRRIEFDPDMYVAQERVRLAQAPVWDAHGITGRPVALRVYLAATANGYCVMPGGLTRISPEGGGIVGGSSKDTWIISDAPVEEISLLHAPGKEVELRRTGNNLPSRLADNFFWLGRYTERADATCRLLRSALQRFNPERTGSALPVLAPILQTLAAQGQLPGLDEKPELRQNAEAFEAELLAAIFDPSRPGSLRQTVSHLFRLAVQVRDRTSTDMWRIISRLHDRLTNPTTTLVLLAGDAVSVLNECLLGLAAFHGLARENMTRAQAWRFIDIGLRIERTIYMGTLLNCALSSPEADNPSVLETVLEVADSSITYRSRYSLMPHIAAVFDLVMLDDKNPRSLLFQLNRLSRHYDHLPDESPGVPAPGRNILIRTMNRLKRSDPRELSGLKSGWSESRTGDAIRHTLADLPKLSDSIAAGYFAHSTIWRTGRDQPA